MQKKILINGVTLDNANLVPLLSKAECWSNNGWKITFIGSTLLKQRLTPEIKSDDFKYVDLGKGYKVESKIVFILRALQSNIKSLFFLNKTRGKFNVVYSVSSVLDMALFPFLLKSCDANIKWVTVFDNTVPLNDPGNKYIRFLGWLFFQISLLLLKKADTVFSISVELKEFLLIRGFKESNIIVTGNAVEDTLIAQAKKSAVNEYDALFVGRINETKGIYDMLKVLRLIKERYPDYRLALMGEGDKKTTSDFKSAVGKMGLEKNVFFLGYKSGIDKFNIIKSSKSYWFLSVSESFGVALLEAVCCGVPAFAYDLPPYREIYKNNEVCFSKKGDYRDVASNVLKLFDNRIFNNEAGKQLLPNYSWDKIAEIEMEAFS